MSCAPHPYVESYSARIQCYIPSWQLASMYTVWIVVILQLPLPSLYCSNVSINFQDMFVPWCDIQGYTHLWQPISNTLKYAVAWYVSCSNPSCMIRKGHLSYGCHNCVFCLVAYQLGSSKVYIPWCSDHEGNFVYAMISIVGVTFPCLLIISLGTLSHDVHTCSVGRLEFFLLKSLNKDWICLLHIWCRLL